MSRDRRIVISLSDSTDVALHKEDGLIQKVAQDRLLKLMAGAVPVNELEDGCDKKKAAGSFFKRLHNAITINGSRGSGKTTFIHNVFSHIEALHGERPAVSDQDKRLAKIEVLGIIDPTLIENKENILVTIITLINKKVAERYEEDRRAREDKYQKARERLKALAGGLSLLDGIGPSSVYGQDWEDPQIILQQGLDKARSGSSFERDFHAYVEAALAYLCKNAFALAFDDIDTQFERGWPVLEAIRKYLTSPSLIVLISGDLSLYSKLVRRAQFMNLGKVVLDNDRPSSTHHRDKDRLAWNDDPVLHLVGKLEEQYLMKVLKPENRITLPTLEYLEREKPEGYEIFVSDGDQEMALAAAIDAVFRAVVNLGSPDELALYRKAVLGQPVRTVIQFLTAARAIVFLDPSAKASDASRDFLQSLPSVFASSFYHFDLDPVAAASGEIDVLTRQLLTWNTRAEVWETGYRLRPEYLDDDRNMVAIVLGALFSRRFRNSAADALAYMVTVGVAREFTLQAGNDVTPAAIVDFLNLNMRERPSTIARRAVGVQRSLRIRKGLCADTVPVVGVKIDSHSALKHLYFGKAAGAKLTPKDFVKYIKDINAAADEKSKNLTPSPIIFWWREAVKIWEPKRRNGINIPLKGYVYNTIQGLSTNGGLAKLVNFAASTITNPRGQDTTYLSIFILLASLSELMAIEWTGNEEADLNRLKSEIKRLSQSRAYPMPTWAAGPVIEDRDQYAEDEDEDAGADGDEESGDINPEFLKRLLGWLKKDIPIDLPPQVWARIITRVYYSLLRMEEEITAKSMYAGDILKQQVVIFLNSVFVEEAISRQLSAKISLDNPITSDDVFTRNVSKIVDAELPLFVWLSSSPLLCLFWKDEEDVKVLAGDFKGLRVPLNSVPVHKPAPMAASVWGASTLGKPPSNPSDS